MRRNDETSSDETRANIHNSDGRVRWTREEHGKLKETVINLLQGGQDLVFALLSPSLCFVVYVFSLSLRQSPCPSVCITTTSSRSSTSSTFVVVSRSSHSGSEKMIRDSSESGMSDLPARSSSAELAPGLDQPLVSPRLKLSDLQEETDSFDRRDSRRASSPGFPVRSQAGPILRRSARSLVVETEKTTHASFPRRPQMSQREL